ncbi:MAG: hypothetical protein ISQ14_07510, partial [Verrucomicrobiae bacterium]|nr:hypothetical protein [Verrucomicrobiae bacterium]
MKEFNRREFAGSIATGIATVGARPLLAFEGGTRQVPFRTLYSNDTTHILSCLRPEHRDVDFTDELLKKSITEAAGVDAHFLQPGLGWMPWWQSKIYPAAEHHDWLSGKHGVQGVQKIGRYLLKGGDMLETLVTGCRESGVAPFLSFRLNDGHHVRELAKALERRKPTPNMARHYWDNYEHFRIGRDVSNWDEGVFDWAIPEVRDYKFALIEEACANYDLAGLELDFLRHWVRFGPGTKREDRVAITTDFVRRIRAMLDRTATARGLPRRWLCARVPAIASVRPEQGIQLAALAKAGVDMVNLSYSYFTWQDRSVAQAREEAPDLAVYAEMTHTTMTGKASAGSGTQPFLRTTDQQFYTTAQLAFEQGAQGVSLFNFPYYRYHVTDTIGPFHEPPFHVLPKLKDRAFLERQPHWHFLSSGRKDRVLGERRFPAILNRNQPQTFPLEMTSAKRTRDGVLRLRSDEMIADREIAVIFNGKGLVPIAFVEKPLPHPYAGAWLGTPAEHACYALPASAVKPGTNRLEICVKRGLRVRL